MFSSSSSSSSISLHTQHSTIHMHMLIQIHLYIHMHMHMTHAHRIASCTCMFHTTCLACSYTSGVYHVCNCCNMAVRSVYVHVACACLSRHQVLCAMCVRCDVSTHTHIAVLVRCIPVLPNPVSTSGHAIVSVSAAGGHGALICTMELVRTRGCDMGCHSLTVCGCVCVCVL